MYSFHESDSDSENDISSDEIDGRDADDFLNFCSKVTDELKNVLKRSVGKDGYCGDIYVDTFTTSESGSFSYYADILETAQLNDKTIERHLSSDDTTLCLTNPDVCVIHPAHWKCTGRSDVTVGAGPLDDLFQVLTGQNDCSESQMDFSSFQDNLTSVPNPTAVSYPPDWSFSTTLSSTIQSLDHNHEEFGRYGGVDCDHGNIDILHRFGNDSHLLWPSSSETDYMHRNYQSY